MNKKWYKNSHTRTALLERFPEGSEVTMKQVQDSYVELSTGRKSDHQKRKRGANVFLRAVSEGTWKGDTEGYVQIKQHDNISYWAEIGSIVMVSKGTKVDGRVIRFKLASGNMQSMRVSVVANLAAVIKACQNNE